MMTRSLLAAALLLMSASAQAETYEKLYEEGHWTVYRVDDVPLLANGKDTGHFDGFCRADGNVADASVQITLPPPQLKQARPDWKDAAWIRVSRNAWNFRKRRALAMIGGGRFTLDFRKAAYEGQEIWTNVSEFKPLAILLVFASGQQTLDVFDWRNRLILQVPTDGLAAARNKLFECAGQKWP